MREPDPPEQSVQADGAGIVAPDDETPTWSERKTRETAHFRLTYGVLANVVGAIAVVPFLNKGSPGRPLTRC